MASEGTSKIAERYSQSLFQLASAAGSLSAVEASFSALKNTINSGDELKQLFATPLPPRAAKAKAMDAVLAKLSADGLTRAFIKQVAAANRLAALPAIIEAFEARMTAHRGEMVVEVASAKPLSENDASALTAALAKRYGRAIRVSAKVDATLIGGLTVKVGGMLMDHSVKNKLARLERALKIQHA